jgi:hypothetical protein
VAGKRDRMRSDPLRGKVKNGSPLDDAKGVVKTQRRIFCQETYKRRMLMMLFQISYARTFNSISVKRNQPMQQP